MKYWFFSGKEILGPFTPQEISVQKGFAATSLICPEQGSENPVHWRPAAAFDCFHFDDETGKLEDITSSSEEDVPHTIPPQKMVQPAKTQTSKPLPAPVQPAPVEKKLPLAAPITLAAEELDLTLPHRQEPSADDAETVASGAGESAGMLLIEEESAEDPQQKQLDEEVISTSSMPVLPEGDIQQVDLKDVSPIGEVPDSDTDAQMSQIKSQLEATPEIEEFLTDQQIWAIPSRKKAHKVLWILLFLFVVGIIWLLCYAGVLTWAKQKFVKPTSQPALEQTQPLVTSPENELVSLPEEEPEQPSQPSVMSAPLSAQDRALVAVKNYYLPNNQETIASYFDRVYQTHLAQGYTAVWSAEPLHQDTYVVKYRLSKARQEPIMYVFQANGKTGQLTGALNNIALDLVGNH